MVMIIGLTGSAPLAHARDGATVTFDEQISPIFKRHCSHCHGETKQKAGLDLSNYAGAIKGGSGGAVVVAGRSNSSRLLEVITADDPAERMPPENDPLPKNEVSLIRAWIDTGLKRDSGSPEVMNRGLGFTPMPSKDKGRPRSMPTSLPAITRAKTVRPFAVLALAASPNAPLVTAGSYECIDLLVPETRSLIGSLPFPQGEPHVLRFSRSGSLLLAAGGRPVRNGCVVLFDVSSGKRLAELGSEADVVMAADISPDERRVALGGSGRLVKIIATENGSVIKRLTAHTEWITAIAYSADGRLLATGDRSGNIHLWDAITGGAVLPLSEHKGSVRALAWRGDSRVLVSVGEDGLIIWWDAAKGWPIMSKANAHPPDRPAGMHGRLANGVLDASFGPSGELVTCGRDRKTRIWSVDGIEMESFSLEIEAKSSVTGSGITVCPTRAALTFDGARILTGDSAGRVHSWARSKQISPK